MPGAAIHEARNGKKIPPGFAGGERLASERGEQPDRKEQYNNHFLALRIASRHLVDKVPVTWTK